jgi:hypothetical protein
MKNHKAGLLGGIFAAIMIMSAFMLSKSFRRRSSGIAGKAEDIINAKVRQGVNAALNEVVNAIKKENDIVEKALHHIKM